MNVLFAGGSRPLLAQLAIMAMLGIAAATMPWLASSYAMTLVYYMAY